MNWVFIISFAIVLEIFTSYLRFGFDFHSKSIQKKCKLPIRVHHMYIGILITIFGIFYSPPVLANTGSFLLGTAVSVSLLEVGLAIALSDVFHHFVVLPAFHKEMDFP